MNTNYWHELAKEEVSEMVANKKSWLWVSENYKQPDWCTYTNALHGKMGCWSLTDIGDDGNGLRSKISEDYCKDCDCFKMPNSDKNVDEM